MPRKAQWPPPIQQHRTAAEKARGSPGRARVRVAGEDITLGPWGSPEADAAYRRLIAELAQTGGKLPRPLEAAALSVADVVARFLTADDHERSAKEMDQFRYSVGPLLALYGPTPAAEFDTLALEKVRTAMAQGGWMPDRSKRQPTPWCRNVCNRRLTRIKTLWKWAERKRLVPEGKSAHLATVRGFGKNSRQVRHTADRTAASLEDARAVARHCTPAVAAMLEVQALAGMRSCEVRVMRPCDIDRGADVWLYRPGRDKNEWRENQAPRVVPLGPECQKILAWWIDRAPSPEAYLFRPQGSGARSECYSDTAYAQAVRRAAERAGVKLQPYCTRHGAKRRITRQFGADAARALLGQKSIETTAHYGGIDVQHAADVAREAG